MNIQNQIFGMRDLKSRIKRTKGFFDWYISTEQILKYFELLDIKKEDFILIIGCGNSSIVKRNE